MQPRASFLFLYYPLQQNSLKELSNMSFLYFFSFQSFLSLLYSVFCPCFVTRIALAEVTNDLLVKFRGKFSTIILRDPSVTVTPLITLFSSIHCLHLTPRYHALLVILLPHCLLLFSLLLSLSLALSLFLISYY